MANYEILLWDLDATLLDFKYAQRHAIIHSFNEIGKVADEAMIELYDKINDGYWKRLERGELSKEEILYRRFVDFFRELNMKDVDIKAFQKNYESTLPTIHRYMDDSLELCKYFKEKQYRQYIVTNGMSEVQEQKLKMTGFDQVMDGFFVPDRIGYAKPDVRFFEACFQQIPDFDRRKAIMIGDSLTSDMAGGYHAGITTCWYNPQGAVNESGLPINYEIHHLQELLQIV